MFVEEDRRWTGAPIYAARCVVAQARRKRHAAAHRPLADAARVVRASRASREHAAVGANATQRAREAWAKTPKARTGAAEPRVRVGVRVARF